MNIELGLVAGRHDLPVTDYIFYDGDITFPINPRVLRNTVAKKFDDLGLTIADNNHITVYVTGLTAATTAVIRVAFKAHHFLTLKHYDKDSGNWIDDHIFMKEDDFSNTTVYPSWS